MALDFTSRPRADRIGLRDRPTPTNAVETEIPPRMKQSARRRNDKRLLM